MAYDSEPASHTGEITTVDTTNSGNISTLHSDIIQTHILTRLDGPTLASTSCTSSQLYALCSEQNLWANICHSTWPSTNTPRLHNLISTFPNGHRSFFSNSTRLLIMPCEGKNPDRSISELLISAVDIYYREKLIFSKVLETETVNDWFRCSPFRVDLIDPKDVVPTTIPYPEGEDTCRDLDEELRLSWIVIDPIGRKAMNLSSQRPVTVQRHWLTGDVQVQFASIFAGEKGISSEFVQCGILVTCGGSEGGELQVRELSLTVEDMDRMHLNGRDTCVIFGRALEGKRVKMKRKEERKKRYKEYLEIKRERKERKTKREGALDMLCAIFVAIIFSLFWLLILYRGKKIA